MEKLQDTIESIIDQVMAHPLLGQNPNSLTSNSLGRQGVKDHLVKFSYYAVQPSDCIKEMIEVEEQYLEEGLNSRWGEDDDPQLIAYRAWEKLKREHSTV
jgi:hypothetical protein